MTTQEYNYAVFNLQGEMGKFAEFQDHPLHAGTRAADFPLEDSQVDLVRADLFEAKLLW